MQSFKTELLTQEKMLAGLAAINRELIAKTETIDFSKRVVLDINSTERLVAFLREQPRPGSSFGGLRTST